MTTAAACQPDPLAMALNNSQELSEGKDARWFQGHHTPHHGMSHGSKINEEGINGFLRTNILLTRTTKLFDEIVFQSNEQQE
jgi:hypothetical protein